MAGARVMGYFYMLVSTTSFTGMAVISKIIGSRASTEEKLFWRSLLSILFTITGALASADTLQRPKHPWLLLLRGFCGHIALLAYLEAIELTPLAEAVFLGKVHPTSASLLSWAFLGERLSSIRGISIGVSILGVGLIAKPSWEGLVSGTLLGPTLALLAGCLSGAAYCCVRSLGRSQEGEMWTLLALPVVSLPFCCKDAWFGLQEGREPAVWVWLLALGVCTQLGQIFLARGLTRLPAASGTQEQRLQLWEQSEPTEEIDVFFSHTWQTAGHWKYLALLFETGSSFSLAAWGVVSATMTLLCCLGAVPLPFGPTTRVLKFEAVTPMGPWIILSGMVASLLGLIASPHAPGLLRRDESCFLDKVCIHQEDPDLMRRGVYGLGVYLRMSKQLRVLWSSPYFTRLWCIFEIAAYAALNSSGRVVLAPVFMGWMQVLLLLCSYYLSVVMWLATIAESLNLSAYLIAISPLCFVTHALRRSFHLRQLVVVELENFDLNAADCRVAADRDFVHEAIIAWYGSTNAFTQYVRGDLRMELLKSIRTNVPRIYVALLATAPLSASLEGFVGLCRAGAPWRSLLSYVVGHTLGIHLFWWYLSIRFLFYLCNLHWWTCSGRWAFVDYLQTLLVFLAFSVFYCLGGMIGYLSYSTNLGAATAFASVALFLNLNSVQSFSGFLHSCLPRRISSRLSTVLPPPPRPLNSVSS